MRTRKQIREDYLAEVADIGLLRKEAASWIAELTQTLLEQEFFVLNVKFIFRSTNEAGLLWDGLPYVEWHGACYDAEGLMYRFIMTWTCDWEKFAGSIAHYYEPAELYVRPELETDQAYIHTERYDD